MLKILYEWITKPYIKWNFIDSIVCFIEIFGILMLGFWLFSKWIER